jgi:hypothetical protein
MKLFDPTMATTYVWQVADPKSSKSSYSASKTQTPPPNAVYGHPIGRYDSDGLFWTYCPNAGEEDPNSPRSSRFVKHPHAEEERRAAVKAKVWGSVSSMGSYKETEF